MNRRRLLVPVLLLLAAMLLAACGGGGGSSDESQIEEAIEMSGTSANPAYCTKYLTQNFAEQSSRLEGAAAIKECEKEAKEPESKAKSIAVSNVEVDGSKATAEAAVTGGSFDGQTLEINLVEDGDQWKLDELAGFAKLDQSKLTAALDQQFKAAGDISEELASCVEEGFEEASKAEVEELVLDGSPQPLEELAEGCS